MSNSVQGAAAPDSSCKNIKQTETKKKSEKKWEVQCVSTASLRLCVFSVCL